MPTLIIPPVTVLLTGARGRLGSFLARELPDKSLKVVSFSRTRGDDIHDLQDLLIPGLWNNANVLIHSGWSAVPLVSERNPGIEWRQDLPFLSQLLQALAVEDRRHIHFIFFSSGGTVYGDALERPSREEDIPNPKGWYGFSKTQAEAFIERFCTHQGIDYTILRISNPYGFAAQANKPQGIISHLIQSVLEGSAFKLWGDGQARKDYLHMNDFSGAIRKIINLHCAGIFNLSFGTSHSVLEIIHLVEKQFNRPIRIIRGESYPWDVMESLVDNQKIQAALNWTPKIDIASGIALFSSQLANKAAFSPAK